MVSAEAGKGSRKQKRRERVVQRVRITVADPDATETSNDEEGPRRKQWVKEVVVLDRAKSKFRGVRQRESGRWAAEIRNPVKGAREWLGTYDTQEEAHLAYQSKTIEFRALTTDRNDQKKKKKTTTDRSSSSSTASPSAVANEFQQCDFGLLDDFKDEDFQMCNLGDLSSLDMEKEDFSWLDHVLGSIKGF